MELRNRVTQNLDSLGLVASIAKESGITERIEKRLGKD